MIAVAVSKNNPTEASKTPNHGSNPDCWDVIDARSGGRAVFTVPVGLLGEEMRKGRRK